MFIEDKDDSYRYTWMMLKMTGKKQNTAPIWKKLMKNVDLDEPTSFLDHVYWRCTQRECKPNEIMVDEYRKMFESRIAAGATEKITRGETSRKDGCVVLGHGRTFSKIALRYGELANEKTAVIKSLKSLLG